ncbi:MAG: DegV family protein [Chloroflexi bacterium]|nr:DegV family protein [Chloroflexota bacterium]
MAKAKVAIVVDSTAYLPQDIIDQYNMYVIPLLVNWEGESLKDNVDITPDVFYKRLTTAKEMPTTSQPSPGDFKVIFEKAAENADAVLCLTISQALSGTYASAIAARQMVEGVPIEVIDSQFTIMGLGFMALAAAKAVADGADYQEAAAIVKTLIPRMRVVFVVDTLEFLHRGGRIGGASRYLGTLLSIKPILHFEEGKIEALTKVRTKKKAVAHMLQLMSKETAGRKTHAAVLHAAAPAEGNQLYARVQGQIAPEELYLSEISPVIGTHTGPGAVAVVYYTEP